ncbi:hypothetical protein FB567DRAFT_528492 [Paraphoma chrysanthemicola]|uniref:Subtilisin-like serine protease n=1 Tax=Paraphoma chrysanthemicola TaxID=798071 RepID=A0A8K0VX22_9PLEO|nr:hypothetical protein FB567DRAFT_528492 [Paraphoma chrysanthemicola]
MASDDNISPVSPTPTCVASFSRASTAANPAWDSTRVPFNESAQLYKGLEYIRDAEKPSQLRGRGSSQTLPDAPRVQLNLGSEIAYYCLKDLDTPDLNKLGEKLWRAGPSPDVVSLSQHMVLDRRIQITEDPSIHLLWAGIEGILYVKPLPAYLTSFAFWEYLLDPSHSDLDDVERKRLVRTSLGFLKTYSSLIQRRSDFNIARRHDLLGGFGGVSFEAFVDFISSFDVIPDTAISSRWHYGVLQLDPLNFHSVLLLRRWHLNRFESRYGLYFSRFFPVILFIFALLSVMLSAMQVIIGAKQMDDTDNKGLKRTLGVFVWASTEAIIWSISFGCLFVLWWIAISSGEAWKRRKAQRVVKKRLKSQLDRS